jgi:NAD(P)-dependent dehydrogenase (short-subunit alcohol dehydrogenase family)
MTETAAPGVAWITGASSGIGRALALELARRGWRVAATARSAEALGRLEGEGAGRIVAFAADVTDPAALAEAVARIEAELGPIALAVLNAGVFLPVRAAPFDRAACEKTFAVNLGGVANALDPLLPRMIARRAGSVWLMASVAGYGPLPTSAAYGATKAGLINLAGSLKFDLDPAGVHIGVVCPGFVDTPLTRKNRFAMPFLLHVEEAARRVADKASSRAFEIAFPRRFAYGLKLLNMLPWRLYFPLVARATKWGER